MPRLLFPVFALLLASFLASCAKETAPQQDERLFELRVYHPFPGKLEALHDRFRNHTLALFEKHGMQHVGYWVTDGADPKLVYLVAFADQAEKEQAWKGFLADPDWKAAYAESIKAGRLVERVDSSLLRTTDFSPAIVQESVEPARVFELRRYQASEGNLASLDERFRSATMDLFAKHGASNLVYFHPADGEPGAEDTLIYLLAYESEAARERMWEAFRKDPEWIQAKTASEAKAGGPLTAKGGVTSQILRPVDYSKIR
ncbi:NIPSNAP family protein [Pelagicoccus sp. SDUM812005]|uniref:NIPSNAP family protein n=1 Tax=Pelagicoccus sp. SDUM812005 TaxID=3041257 RepID=UPI00280D58B7|nr:NIPSNAP family protein [Pelagicoccus sp. SDUM812005]MDQ8180232.1 NIPSNAP family protein [Pelagicoccus sp. SDUM812005]